MRDIKKKIEIGNFNVDFFIWFVIFYKIEKNFHVFHLLIFFFNNYSSKRFSEKYLIVKIIIVVMSLQNIIK